MKTIQLCISPAIVILAISFVIFLSGCDLIGPSEKLPATTTSTTTTTGSTTSTTGPHAWITDHNPHLQPNMAKPNVGAAYADPVFGATVMRLTDAVSMGADVGNGGVVPDYSKRQAWNFDESKLLLRGSDGSVLLYNGATYELIKKLASEVGGDDIFWHPSNNALIYYIIENRFYSFNVNTDANSLLRTFSDYDFIGTPGEGNLSSDGRYCALVGRMYVAPDVFVKALLVYDIISNEVTSTETFSSTPESFDWVSISPKGNYVVVDYADETVGNYHGVEVYDKNFNRKWQKPLGAGHSDLGIDSNGDEVLVMGIYDPDTNTEFIKKYRLEDGAVTTLLELSLFFDYHISCRNEQRPGWSFISTFDYVARLSDEADNPALDWLPFEDEVFALKMDGSESVERYAHHHSRRYSPSTYDSDHSVYFAEPHATVSRQANRILFGSNWRQNMSSESSIDTYVIDLR